MNIFDDKFKLLQQIVLNVPNYIFWKDKDLIYRGCNYNFAKFVGFDSPLGVIGKTDQEMPWARYTATIYQEEDKQVLQGKEILDKEVAMVTGTDERTLSVSKIPLYDDHKKIIGVLGIYIDVTDRKRLTDNLLKAKEAAEAADRAKTEFLENMRHDIRTPLSGIIGCATLIKENIDNPEKIQEVKEYVDNQLASSNTLLTLLNNILQALKVASGEIPQQKRKFNLYTDLQKVIQLNQAKADQKKLQLLLAYDQSIPNYVVGDNERIFYVVLELVTNALKFTDKGYVKVTTQLAKEEERIIIIKISIEDTGVGIPPDKQEEIFMRFKRLTPSYVGVHKGLGLGLSNVKQFIDDLDGEINVNSPPPKKGTIFTCILRLTKALLNEEQGVNPVSIQSPEAELRLRAKMTIPHSVDAQQKASELTRVLVVEDQPLAAKVAGAILKGLDCSVDIAENGESGVAQAKNKPYDLILMDVGLPGISGNEATRQIREWESLVGDKHIPVIALTAHVEVEDKEECIKSGMNAVLSKPLTKETAWDILNAFIPKRSTQWKKTKEVDTQECDADQVLFELPEATLDYDKAVKLVGGKEDLVKELVQMLVNSLPEEFAKLQEAYQKQEWGVIQMIAHKLKGGAAYCAAERLAVACGNLETYFKSAKTELREKLYGQLLHEIENIERMSDGLDQSSLESLLKRASNIKSKHETN